MKQLYTLCLATFFLGLNFIQAQTPNWSSNVASIIYNNCTKCHNTDGIAPFPLESYDNAVAYGSIIPTYINNGTMPPWPPDPTYRHYVNERVLTQAQIDTIDAWVAGGTPEGDEAVAPPVPHFNNGAILGPPDQILQIPNYTSTATSSDDYACFVLPLNIPNDKYLKAVQILPGNPKIVHHVIMMIDTTAAMTNQDCMLALANIPGDNSAVTLTSWAAGMQPTVFPSGEGGLKMGERLKAGSNIMLQIHYPIGTAGQVDSTKVLLYYYSDSAAAAAPPLRLVNVGIYCMNWLLYIGANSTATFTATYPGPFTITYTGSATTTNQAYSIVSVDPHMHYIGRQMTSWGISPTGDTIPFERVNNWQFNWQAYYFFNNLIKLDSGSVIDGTAFYDNTTNNPYNPNNPPIAITAGENSTTNEMMLIAFMEMPYQTGDENYNMDSLINLAIATYPVTTGITPIAQGQPGFTVFPNPASGGQFTLTPSNLKGGVTDVSIVDMLGQTVKTIHYDNLTTPVNITVEGQADGMYLVELKQGKYSAIQKIVLNK
jgi:hypothetical protein